MNFNEKMKELSERFSGEMEALKISTSTLRVGKEKEEARFEEVMGKVLAKHAAELHVSFVFSPFGNFMILTPQHSTPGTL